MALQTRIGDLITAVGTDYKQLRSFMTGASAGAFSLSTTAQDIKGAIAELESEITAAAAGMPSDATEAAVGVGEIATQAEATAGTDDFRWITSLKLAQKLTAWAQPLNTNLTALAGQATTAYGRALLNLANQAGLVALLPTSTDAVVGVQRNATQAETNTGTLDTAQVTPLKLQTRLVAYSQPLDSDLTSIAALTTSTHGRSLLVDTTPAASRTTLGLSAVASSGSAADLTGLLPTSALPPLAVNKVDVVASQAAMLALVSERGDVAVRTDNSNTYILATDSPTTLADWKEITATGDVVSVNGSTGVVVLTKASVGLTSVDDTSDSAKPVSTAQQTALNLKANIASPTFTGTVGGVTAAMVGLGSVNNTADSAKPVSTAQQTALNGKQDLDSDLTAIAALTSAADKFPYATGAGTWALGTVTAAARTLLDDIDVAAMRSTLSVYSQAEIGNPETDLVALYTTAKA